MADEKQAVRVSRVKELATELIQLLKSMSYANQEDAWDKFISTIEGCEELRLCTSCCRLHCSGYCDYDSVYSD